MENYYQLLNISPLASKEELEKAILQQQRLWHSRVNSADFERRVKAERMLRKLEEIQDVLLDDKKRETYNRNLLALVISSYRPETVEQNKTTDSVPEEKDDLLDEKEPTIDPLERSETTQVSKTGDDLESTLEATINDLSNDDDIVQDDQKEEVPSNEEKQVDQQDLVHKVEPIGKDDKSSNKETNAIAANRDRTNRTAEFVLGVIGGILGLISVLTRLYFFETFFPPILLLLVAIVGIVGAILIMFHSNARTGGLIMAIAGIGFSLLSFIFILLSFIEEGFIIHGPITCFPLLIAGLMGIFRKEAVSENKKTHTFLTNKYNTRRTTEFIFGIIGCFLGLILAFNVFPLLTFFVSIAGIIGVILIMFHSNVQIGGFITTIAGVVFVLLPMSIEISQGTIEIFHGATAGLSLLLAGLIGIFRKEAVSGNKNAHTFLTRKYNPKRTAEFLLGVIGGMLALILSFIDWDYFEVLFSSNLILSASITSIVGAILIMFHSNAQIGGIIMTIAGIIHLFSVIHMFLGAIASLPLLIAGFMGVFRKN